MYVSAVSCLLEQEEGVRTPIAGSEGQLSVPISSFLSAMPALLGASLPGCVPLVSSLRTCVHGWLKTNHLKSRFSFFYKYKDIVHFISGIFI